jgi:hypothetical protein
MDEAASYAPREKYSDKSHEVLAPLRIRMKDSLLAFFSTTTVFGTPLEVTLSEIAIESFFPADAATRTMVAGGRSHARA